MKVLQKIANFNIFFNQLVYEITKSKFRQHLIVDALTMGTIATHSRVEMAELHMREARLLNSGRSAILPVGTASYGHFRNTRVFSASDLTEVMSVANRALEIALATRDFKDRCV